MSLRQAPSVAKAGWAGVMALGSALCGALRQSWRWSVGQWQGLLGVDARGGCLCHSGLSLCVGLGDERLLPQVVALPHGAADEAEAEAWGRGEGGERGGE